MKVLVIPENDVPYVDEANGLNDLQRLVGGWIEAIEVKEFAGELLPAYINEDGKFECGYNEIGTQWFLNAYPHANDYICGPVVVFGGFDEDGNDLPIPDDLARMYE